MEVRSLFVRFGADTSNLSTGTAEVKKKLTDLNNEFYANQKAMKELEKERKSLTNGMAAIDKQAKKTGEMTEEQRMQYEKLSSELSQLTLKKGQYKANQQALQVQIKSTTSELKKQNDEMYKTDQTAASTTNSIGNLATAVKALMFGYTGKKLFDSLIGSNAEMEQFLTAFETALGSADKAKALMDDIVKLTASTPLKLDSTVNLAQLLNSYGVGADILINKMRTLGDLGKGNVDKINSIAAAYGKMYATNKVDWENLKIMLEAGVPILQTLADQYGVTTAKMQEYISKGKVGLTDLDQAMTSLTTGNGQFAGAMEAQSQTMNGLLSTLSDNFTQFGRDVGEQSFGVVKNELSNLMIEIQKASSDGSLDELANNIGNSFGHIAELFAESVKLMVQYRGEITALASAVAAFKVTMKVTDTLQSASKRLGELAIATDGAKNAVSLLNTTMLANPWFWLAAGITALTATFAYMAYENAKTNRTMKEYSDEMDRVKSKGQIIVDQAEDEITLIKAKAHRYEELRIKYNETSEGLEALKNAANDLNSIMPNSIDLINAETGAYMALGDEIEMVIQKMRLKAVLGDKEEQFNTAAKQNYEIEERLKEIYKPVMNFNLDKNQGNYPNYIMGEGFKFYKDNKESFALDNEYKALIEQKNQNQAIMDDYQKFLEENLESINGIREEYKTVEIPPFTTINSDLEKGVNNQKKILNQWISAEQKAYDQIYNARKKSITERYNQQTKAIDEELKAEEKRINALIANIDKEIAARKKQKEEENYQSEIDVIKAKLKYAQLDDFTRKQLEAELAKKEQEWADKKWEEEKQAEKDALREELANAKEVASLRKEELREYQAELMESLEKERAQVQEMMSFIGNNFTSLAQLQSSGITDIQQLFVYATQKDMQAINSTFSLLSGKTQEVGNLYTSTVNASIGATFDYGVQRAEDALRALNRAIGRANEKASEIERSLERQSSNSNTYNTRNSTYNITNPYLDADQIARKIQDSLYDPY